MKAILAAILCFVASLALAAPPLTDPIYPGNLAATLNGLFPTGTWTPDLRGSTAAGTVSYAADGQLGDYAVSGNIVVVRFHIITTAISGATGATEIGALPVPPSSLATTVRGGCSITFYDGITLPAGYTTVGGWVSTVDNAIALTINGSGQTGDFINPATALAAATTIDGSCTYFTGT